MSNEEQKGETNYWKGTEKWNMRKREAPTEQNAVKGESKRHKYVANACSRGTKKRERGRKRQQMMQVREMDRGEDKYSRVCEI